MRLKEYTSLPKSADISFKMTHLPKFCGFQILNNIQHIFPLLILGDGLSGFKAAGTHSVHPQSYGVQRTPVFIGLTTLTGKTTGTIQYTRNCVSRTWTSFGDCLHNK